MLYMKTIMKYFCRWRSGCTASCAGALPPLALLTSRSLRVVAVAAGLRALLIVPSSTVARTSRAVVRRAFRARSVRARTFPPLPSLPVRVLHAFVITARLTARRAAGIRAGLAAEMSASRAAGMRALVGAHVTRPARLAVYVVHLMWILTETIREKFKNVARQGTDRS